MIQLLLYVRVLFQTAGGGCMVPVGREIYNFSALSKKVYEVQHPANESGVYNYKASFCNDLALCGRYLSGSLVRFKDGVCLSVYGQWATMVNVKTLNGFRTEFESPQFCFDNFYTPDKSEFNFICDTSAGDIGRIEANQLGNNTCAYSVDVYTGLVCEGVKSSENLLWGYIFLIIIIIQFAVVVLAKFVGLPKRDIWRKLPSHWIEDGWYIAQGYDYFL